MKKESDCGSSASGYSAPPRKLKFAPKVPVRKQPNPAIVKTQLSPSKVDIVDKELLAKLNCAKSQDGFGRKFKMDKKAAPAQVTFGPGNTSMQARSFGTPKTEVKNLGSSFETPKLECKSEDISELHQTKEHAEPWDYTHSYYPVSLPLRRPYMGSSEVLDGLEFGESCSARIPINDNQINTANKLGFMETNGEPKMIFFQFPTHLPSILPHMRLPHEENRRESNTDNLLPVDVMGLESKISNAPRGGKKGPESKTGNASYSEKKVPERKTGNASNGAFKLKDFPDGFVGKLLVYKSGKVKMKFGDLLFEVFPGIDNIFAEEVVAVNVNEKRYCLLGEVSKHALVSPDLDFMLDNLMN